ncbi:phospholipase D [Tilletiaria anomala UBC 951]|uniref:Phospholipase n=1 Tax=Tilletiaria anomala (strain ATCC 24038 / CBS 436.72 / UBC 951) TaxID=1037660 RepID=A0A066V981_TILAU|nr:phospholipase D [Tilletiaria anomala UBC 951]KDN38041.1 phospholipase D [Tilletiaria anomala UBC 951]
MAPDQPRATDFASDAKGNNSTGPTPAAERPLSKALGAGSLVQGQIDASYVLDAQQDLDRKQGGSRASVFLSRPLSFLKRQASTASLGSGAINALVLDAAQKDDKTQTEDEMLHQSRGPMWASRPDQEQRNHINALKRDLKSSKNLSSTLKSAVTYRQSSFRSMVTTSGPPTPSTPNVAPGKLGNGQLAEDRAENGPDGAGAPRLGSLLGGGDGDRRKEQAIAVTKDAFSRPIRGTVQEAQKGLDVQAQKEEDCGQQQHQGTSSPSQTRKMMQISHLMMGRLSGRANPGDSGGIPGSTCGQSPEERGQQQEGSDGENPEGPSGNIDVDAPQSPNTPRPVVARARWSALKRRINQAKTARSQKRKLVGGPDLTQELQSGILPVLLLKMSIERDEQKNRRIPVLLNHLRLKITDSVNPLSTHAVFRIELEYGDGLVKWVVYRELKDFINLHTHYRAAALRGKFTQPLGTGSSTTEGDLGLHSFPLTSLPYFTQLHRQGKAKKAEFASAQREALETYIIQLIRRTMFRPEANRLCKFFEISALSVSLASRGGYQGKQGYLRILSKSSRKSEQQASLLTPWRWVKSHEPKWFIVRESFIAIVDEPDSLQIHDVFLMDTEFEIVRPKRIYRQTMSLAQDLRQGAKIGNSDDKSGGEDDEKEEDNGMAKCSEAATKIGIEKSKTKGKEPENASRNINSVMDILTDGDRTALLTGGQFRTPRKADGNELDGNPNAADNVQRGERDDKKNKGVSAHTFFLKNSERKLRLVAKNERQMHQFIASMEAVAARNVFTGGNRFGSFAPIRLNVNAQWLVDGRDYFWNLSKALLMAKDRIFIHDWWLSPELYLRRPGKPKWRLDNILKKKAEEGVKIFVILYNEVSNNFTPTDSNYTKQRLISLHRNIYVQRSPSHFQTGTFYWAHHEKLCVIDETVAFMGGLDLCFGRWDTPGHVLIDDADGDMPPPDGTFLGPTRDGAEARIWPGQDYANERVMEWHTLSKPEEDLFSREKFPRMPWHDTGLQLVGQPARDLCRHFVQRWNFLLRIKNHSRVMPFLLPPPDFTPEELIKFGLTGTIEAQICRSCGPWSMGTNNKVEYSIQNAYLKAIQMSEHFVYIENQFFVTSTTVDATKIENQLGDALVHRIIRAHREGTHWRAVIVIPLIPGFPMPIDHPDASSVRLIVECQYRAICRGEHSIFGRLRREGISPEDYISFFSLRTWGTLRGGLLTTEQVYIHGKIMIVDDRLAIIGSANINERSQRGDRDSELACVLRDTDLIDSTMAGVPFKVGRFAHTLRLRLMREHLGIDVDGLDSETVGACGDDDSDVSVHELDDSDGEWDPENERTLGEDDAKGHMVEQARGTAEQYKMTISATTENLKPLKALEAINGMVSKKAGDVKPKVTSGRDGVTQDSPDPARADQDDECSQTSCTEDRSKSLTVDKPMPHDVVPTVEGQVLARQESNTHATYVSPPSRANSVQSGRSGRDSAHNTTRSASVASHLDEGSNSVKRKMSTKLSANPWSRPGDQIDIDPDCFEDPIADDFYLNRWMAIAVRNTHIYRKVFKCVPDDTVTTWSDYKAFLAWSDRLSRSQNPSSTNAKVHLDDRADQYNQRFPVDPLSVTSTSSTDSQGQRHSHQGGNTSDSGKADVEQGETLQTVDSAGKNGENEAGAAPVPPSTARPGPLSGRRDQDSGADQKDDQDKGKADRKGHSGPASAHGADPGFSPEELRQMENLLEETQGHLVVFPTRWLEKEGASGNLLFPSDALLPLNVYD